MDVLLVDDRPLDWQLDGPGVARRPSCIARLDSDRVTENPTTSVAFARHQPHCKLPREVFVTDSLQPNPLANMNPIEPGRSSRKTD